MNETRFVKVKNLTAIFLLIEIEEEDFEKRLSLYKYKNQSPTMRKPFFSTSSHLALFMQ